MERFYVLRNAAGELFAGFKSGNGLGKFEAVFVKPAKDKSVQVNVIHQDDVAETEKDLAKHCQVLVDRVQVG